MAANPIGRSSHAIHAGMEQICASLIRFEENLPRPTRPPRGGWSRYVRDLLNTRLHNHTALSILRALIAEDL